MAESRSLHLAEREVPRRTVRCCCPLRIACGSSISIACCTAYVRGTDRHGCVVGLCGRPRVTLPWRVAAPASARDEEKDAGVEPERQHMETTVRHPLPAPVQARD